MADISKITLLNGNQYNIKDAAARPLIGNILSTQIVNANNTVWTVDISHNEAVNAFLQGRRVILRNNNFDLVITYYNDEQNILEGYELFLNTDSLVFTKATWDSTGNINVTGRSQDIPIPEEMSNVKTMLSKYSLDTTTIYTEPTADTATADGTIVQ